MPKLYFRYAAMNAGKSTALLQVAHNYEEMGRRVAIYTSAVDTRHGVGNVTSRLGLQRTVAVYDQRTDFGALLAAERAGGEPPLSCVLVEEAQFLTPVQVSQLHRYASLPGGVPVICYGLRADFLGEPFPGAAYLLALAEDVEEIKTICSCGKKATMNPRVDPQGRRVVVGEQIGIEGPAHRYQPMCARCFYGAEPAP